MDEIGAITSLQEADIFLNSMVRVYAVATLGYFIYAGLDRLSAQAGRPALPPHYAKDQYSDESEPEDDSDGNDNGSIGHPVDMQEDQEDARVPVNVPFPIEAAEHDVNADISCAFTVYHITPDHLDTKYIIMRYDRDTKAFLYWCDMHPGWDILQATARKFVSENRCAALYESAEVTTASPSRGQDGESESTQETATSAEQSKDAAPSGSDEEGTESVTTKVDNVYVKAGRLAAFRTMEKQPTKHTQIDYKMFRSARSGGRVGVSV